LKLLLDTHLLLWAAGQPEKLSVAARALLEDPDNELLFSPASLWEVAVKRGLGRADFQVDPRQMRRGLLDNGYSELPITSEHAVAVDGLPPIHKDPFDRMLVAQATVEGVALLTADPLVAQYSGPEQTPDAMRVRRSTVEHPYATIKAWMGATHFLTKALERVKTEMSLHVLAYNLKRMMALMGISALMNAMRA
jgi:PIN domain nuclease of toxin-antitoxin system